VPTTDITTTTVVPIVTTTTELPLVEDLVVSDLSSEQIQEVFSEENLESLSDEQITELISNIEDSDLTDEQAELLAEALTNAPDSVKEEFEEQINIFGGQFDSYVPTGSNISVGERRVLIAATAVAFTMPAAAGSAGVSSRRR
jgi:hypothetical protein